MSVTSIPPFLYSKTGVCRGIPNFLIFDPKHTMWVVVRNRLGEAVLMCTHKVSFKQNYKKKFW